MDLLKRNKHPICYDGFEPSGRMHIAQVKPLNKKNNINILGNFKSYQCKQIG